MPWGRVDDSFYDHPKVDRLPAAESAIETVPGDGIVRLAAVGLWWRSISWCNRFLTDGHVPRSRVQRLDGSIELAELLVAAGLYEETADGYLVHDFLEFNDSREDVLKKRAVEAKRQAEWREKKRRMRNGVTDSVTPSVDEPDVTPVVTASVTASVTPVPARATRGTPAAESRPGPGPVPAPGPGRESLRRESRASARLDIAALRDRGFKRVSAKQRAVLDELADRHRRDGNDGTWFASEAIAAANGTDPFKAALDADRMWQDAQRRRAAAEEAAWSAAKEPAVVRTASTPERISAEPPDWLTPKGDRS